MPALAWQRVSHHVIAEQAKHVAIPRRFGVIMQEIWALQPRFEQRAKKRVYRLLAHPRFRAAYDFLLLRAAEGPEIAELGQWWTQAQTLSPEALAGHVAPVESSADPATQPASARKRVRRRGRKKPADTVAPAE